ncbi:MAG: ketoacyl-ACP synthase III [Clostridiales bacterium]|nr:ketoacyl-ACP synthase III [Clostridiales bacterium]
MSFRILGTGMFVPERIVKNDELSNYVDTNDEWIVQRVGIKERRIATHETCTDMAAEAAKAALDNAGIDASDLDLIIASTVSGDYASPSLACMVQKRIGATCMAFDVSAACSAFLFLLETAAGYFARGKAKKVLVVSSERLSRILDWSDRSTCVIFGDGAGAVVLEEGDNYIDAVFNVTGDNEVLKIPMYTGESPFNTVEPEKPVIHMMGQETFKYAVTSICNDVKALLEQNNLTLDDIKYIVPHQANKRIIDMSARRLGVPVEKFCLNIDRYGNTSSASVPIVLDELNRNGSLNRGDLLLLTAFGGGLSDAACLIKW